MAGLFLGIGLSQLHPVALADVAAMGIAQIGSEQVQRQRMTAHILHQLLEFILPPMHPQAAQQLHPGGFGQTQQLGFRRGGLAIGF